MYKRQESVIQKTADAGLVQFSPSNTNIFEGLPASALYFRTIEPDSTQGQVIAQQGFDQGNTSAGAIFLLRDDIELIANKFKETFEQLGGTVAEFIPFPQGKTDFSAEVTALVNSGVTTIFVGTAFVQAGQNSIELFEEMNAQGLTPSTVDMWAPTTSFSRLGEAVQNDATTITPQYLSLIHI